MSILYEDQQSISHDIYKGLNNLELYNIPTGRGKTFILLDVAMRCFHDDGKDVIISVSNNYLVREMYDIAKKYFDTKEDGNIVSIQIGKDNYIDVHKLVLNLENKVLEKLCTADSLQRFMDKYHNLLLDGGELFFDTFNDEVEYVDVANQFIVHELLKDKSIETVVINGVTITNHYYLLSKSIYSKDFDLEEYVVLVDEVHEIADVFMQISTSSFSFFDYKNMMQQIKREIDAKDDFVGKITLIDALKKQSIRANNSLKKNIMPLLVGEYTTLHDKINPIREDVVSLLGKKEHTIVKKQVTKQEIDVSSYFSKVSDIYEGITLDGSNTNRVSLGLYYSPSLGYPTLSISSSNPLGKLHGLFWNKIKYFAGVSGSVTFSFTPNLKEISYGYSRLGFLKKDDIRRIHYYDRIFPRENIAIKLIEKSFYEGVAKESVYSKDFDEKNSPYYEKITAYIHNNHGNLNSMILCSGYKEAQYLAKLYALKYKKECTVHYSEPSVKPMITLKRFKKEGGIFFATKNYGTGTSLEGDYLVNLFILKMPYPDYTSKFWQELKKKGEGIFRRTLEREMMITLMQILGRVARTKEDKGSIFLVDYHFSKKPKNKKSILKIIKEYGTIKVSSKKQLDMVKYEKMKELFS